MPSVSILTNSINVLGSIRFECALAKYIGISLTPEYTYALKKGEAYEQLTQAIPAMKGFEGFGLRVGLHLY